jgi:hypothetical protein
MEGTTALEEKKEQLPVFTEVIEDRPQAKIVSYKDALTIALKVLKEL